MELARRLPEKFVAMLAEYPAFDGLADALAHTAPQVSVRLNVHKNGVVPVGADTVPWCPQGVYLPDRPEFTLDPAMHQGVYYVQDASSMVFRTLAQMLCEKIDAESTAYRPLRWLDACAAPGGKTTAVADALPDGSLVVANEYDMRRAHALVENVERLGNPRVVVTAGDTSAYKGMLDFFDVVAVDAPCSGEGMMRKEDAAVAQWSPALVQSCAETQKQIIDNVWPSLRPGGYLVYSTCTFNTVEDEDIAAYACTKYGAVGVDTGLAGRYGIIGQVKGDIPVLRFLPGRVRGEGLFVCVLKKPDENVAASALPAGRMKCKNKSRKKENASKPLALPREWFSEDVEVRCDADGKIVRVVPKDICRDVDLLLNAGVRVLSAGVTAATVRGCDVMPAFGLAQSWLLVPAAFAQCDVDYAMALAYLRGESIVLPDVRRGIVMITYGGRPLGFVKNLGTRANNLLADTRRIRLRHTPDTPVDVLSSFSSLGSISGTMPR